MKATARQSLDGRAPKRRSKAAFTAGLATLLITLTPRVRAQESESRHSAAEATAPGAVRVLVATDEEGLLLTVWPPGCQPGSDWGCPGRPIVSCYGRCEFWAPPGSYSLRATKPERNLDEVLTLRVQQNSAFRVSAGNPGAEALGLLAGIAGPVAGVIGTFLVVSAFASAECDICTVNSEQANAGYALIGAGAVVTPLGWVAFALNRPRVVPIAADSAARAAELKLGVQPLAHGGMGLGLSMQF